MVTTSRQRSMNYRNFMREAISEIASLSKEGYSTIYDHYDSDTKTLIHKMHHCRNGNIVIVKATSDGFSINKNGSIVKTTHL